MKNIIIISLIILGLMMTSCVQKTYKKTIVFTVDVSKQKDIKTVGIRGEKPFDWNYDNEMKVVKKDSLYTITKTFETGYKFVEIKFTVNGEFEFKDQDNRRVYFSDKDTTFCTTKFNVL